jgi:hypothetical protein
MAANSANSANSASAAIAAIPTIAARVKELMAKMPDTLNTKKEIDEYYKDVVKKVKETMNTGGKAPRKALGVKADKAPKAAKAPKVDKAPKAAKAAKAEPKKRVKKVDVDADGNEIEKVKKPPNPYQKFIQDNRPKVKEDNPTMTGVEIFTLLAQKWNEHKKAMNGEESDNDKDKSDGSKKKDSSDDDDEISEDDDDKKKTAKAANTAVAKSVKAAKTKKEGS